MPKVGVEGSFGMPSVCRKLLYLSLYLLYPFISFISAHLHPHCAGAM